MPKALNRLLDETNSYKGQRAVGRLVSVDNESSTEHDVQDFDEHFYFARRQILKPKYKQRKLIVILLQATFTVKKIILNRSHCHIKRLDDLR
jgi:hypothetical protein